MSLAIITACLSSVSLSIMIIFDRLMLGNCYKNHSDHAWLVSSFLGATFGLVATAITWLAISLTTDIRLVDIVYNFTDLFWPNGLLMLIVGMINIQVMKHYFKLLISSEHQGRGETVVAMWLASVPIFIFFSTFFLTKTPLVKFIPEANISLTFGILVVLACLSMLFYEYANSDGQSFKFIYAREVVAMVFLIVFYNILSSTILRGEDTSLTTTLALQPYYWLGFAAGVRLLLKEKSRNIFINNFTNIKLYLIPIIVVEIIGMLVYYFEFFALSDVDPTLVNLIIAGHIVPVFIFSLLLYKLHKSLVLKRQDSFKLLGIVLATDDLPSQSLSLIKYLAFILVSVLILLAILNS